MGCCQGMAAEDPDVVGVAFTGDVIAGAVSRTTHDSSDFAHSLLVQER